MDLARAQRGSPITPAELSSWQAISRLMRVNHALADEWKASAREQVAAALREKGLIASPRSDAQRRAAAASTPTLATISGNAYWWGFNFVFPEASMQALESSGNIVETFLQLLGAIVAELEVVLVFVEAFLKVDLAVAKAVDDGAGVYLSATWVSPFILVPTPILWEYINSSLGNSLVLDVQADGTSPGTLVDVWPQKSGSAADNQLWTYVNSLYLQSKQSGLVLDIANANWNPGATVDIWSWNGGTNQQWTIAGDSTIRSLMSGNVLDVTGGSTQPGTLVVANPPTSPPSQEQQWITGLGEALSCNNLVTWISNPTSRQLYVIGQAIEGTELQSPVQQQLPPGGIAQYIALYNDYLEVNFGIWDPSYSSERSVASFDVHQHNCVLEAGDVWANNFQWIGGYTLNSQPSDWVEGSYAEGMPGTITCTVEYTAP